MQVLRRGEIEQQRVQRAGKGGDEAGDGERRPDVALDADAEEFHAPPVFADRHPGMAERRLQQRPHHGDGDA